MKLTLATLVGFLLGVAVSAVGVRAQFCCAIYDTPLNLQIEMDHAARLERERSEPLPFSHWTPPAVPSRPCDR